MKDKKRIGLLIPSLQSGGAERVLAKTSELLANRGYEVYFFVYLIEGKKYEVSGRLINLNLEPGKNIFEKIIVRIKRIIKFTYLVNTYSIDTVISFLYSANIVNYLSLTKNEKIISCRGFTEYSKYGNKYAKYLPKLKSLIVQTDRLKKEFAKNYKLDINKINVLPNPIDVKPIQEKAVLEISIETKEFISNHFTICAMGSFKRDKGYWHLLKVFNYLKQKQYKIRLLIIGTGGEMETEIKEMAKKSNYSNDVLFLDYQSNPHKFIDKCDVFVSTSLYEGFPNAIIESLAVGTPVIAPDCLTGPREILSENDLGVEKIFEYKIEKYGILVPELGEEIDYNINELNIAEKELSRAIIKLIEDNNLRKELKELGIQRAKDFSEDSYINYLLKIIE